MPLDKGRDGKRWLLVDHDASGGSLTVLDADAPDRTKARALVGFLYTNLLERDVP